MIDAKVIVKAFCERLGIEAGADTEGVYSFSVDDVEFAIHDLSEEELVLLTGDLSPVPPNDVEGLFRLMLEAQHNFQGTAGAMFSIDSERDCFVLSRVIPYVALDEDMLFSEVERFVNHLEAWTHIIRNYEGCEEPDESLPDSYSIKV